MAPAPVRLRGGDLRVELAPGIGGAMAGFWVVRPGGRLDLLRPASAAAWAAGEPTGMGCYPLVPYSNRIRHGRFTFEGRAVQLPLNFGDHPHSIHGHGWQAPWQAVQTAEGAATLTYRHPAKAWPFPYAATQRFELSGGGLSVALSLENLGERNMPAGLGFHPFFPRTPRSRLTAGVERVWLTDGEVMPTRLVAPEPAWNLNAGIRPERVAMDNGFTGWNRTALLEWPEHGCRMTLSAEDGLGFLVVFTPPGEPFFCAEPVSHCTDAFNLAPQGVPDTGMRVLAPGETWTVRVRLVPEFAA